MRYELIIAALGTGLLVWAAVQDVRRRTIPVLAGFGMLLLGLVVLIAQSRYLLAGYFVVAIWCTRGGVWRIVLAAALIVVLWLGGRDAVPLVLGTVFVAILFWRMWFGRGDAEVALGLMGVGHDWLVVGLVFGLTILTGIVLTVAGGCAVVSELAGMQAAIARSNSL
jgi:hypothetical protein